LSETTGGDDAARKMYLVPEDPAEMLPPKQADIFTEASNFLREHWKTLVPVFQAISGEKPSIHGSLQLDDSACVFAMQKIAKENGYVLLGSVNAARLRYAMRRAYKRNWGVAQRMLEEQNKSLRIEQRRVIAAAKAEAKAGSEAKADTDEG
jgi:hypothetical protein